MDSKDSKLWLLIALLVAVMLLSGMMGFGLIIMLLFLGAVIWLVISLINSGVKNSGVEESTLTILKKRYARGEITREQFLEIEKELTR
ncbi:MAG: SHOCT domain-containing protein [Candidatus Methanoperedens sp.]|nr:SHOCT domain-containing protein [Candidatus Methanoperedens sp.]